MRITDDDALKIFELSTSKGTMFSLKKESDHYVVDWDE